MARRRGSDTFTLMKKFAESPMESEYTFQVQARKDKDGKVLNGLAGEAAVHRIRVELSRTRAKFIQAGHKLKEFKMILISIKTIGEKDVVTLKKSQTLVQQSVELIPELLANHKPRAVPVTHVTPTPFVLNSLRGTQPHGNRLESPDRTIKTGTESK